jgi:hypothetical protein
LIKKLFLCSVSKPRVGWGGHKQLTFYFQMWKYFCMYLHSSLISMIHSLYLLHSKPPRVTFYNIDLRTASDERKRPCFEAGFGRWGSSLHGKSWPGVSQVTKKIIWKEQIIFTILHFLHNLRIGLIC